MPQCDRVLVLRAGKLLALAPWHELAALQLPELVGGAAAAELMHEEEDDQRPAEAGRIPTDAGATVSNVSNGDGAAANGYSDTSDGSSGSSGSPGSSEVTIEAANDDAIGNGADDRTDGGAGAPAISEPVARRPMALRATLSRLFAAGPGAAGGAAPRSRKQRGRSDGGGDGGPYKVAAEDEETDAAGGKGVNGGAGGDGGKGFEEGDADGKGAKEGGTDEIGKLVSAEERQQGCVLLVVWSLCERNRSFLSIIIYRTALRPCGV